MDKLGNGELFMHRAIELAKLGAGKVSPNPMVGCVLVRDGEIIGEGWHREFGGLHAEAEALRNCPDPQGATAYVTLEPCSHQGKQPPCADALIRAGIRKVIVAVEDPYPEVSGRGIARLREAGIEVEVGSLKEEAEWMNRRFLTFHRQHRPYVVLKWAQSTDGWIAPADGKRLQLSGPLTQALVHRWRAEEDAILIGRRTAEMDDPQLNVRKWVGKSPLQVVIDLNNRLSNGLKLFTDGGKALIINAGPRTNLPASMQAQIDPDQNVVQQTLRILHARYCLSVLVEGGTETLIHFMKAESWDEARILVAPSLLREGISAPFVAGHLRERFYIGEDRVEILTRQRSNAGMLETLLNSQPVDFLP